MSSTFDESQVDDAESRRWLGCREIREGYHHSFNAERNLVLVKQSLAPFAYYSSDIISRRAAYDATWFEAEWLTPALKREKPSFVCLT